MIGGRAVGDGDEYSKRTLDFVQRMQQLTDYDEICRNITTELDWFGFSCVTSWSLPGPGGHAAAGVVMNTRPQEFIDRYCERNYVAQDPTILELRRTLNPYSWSDVRKRRDLNKAQKSVHEILSVLWRRFPQVLTDQRRTLGTPVS